MKTNVEYGVLGSNTRQGAADRLTGEDQATQAAE